MHLHTRLKEDCHLLGSLETGLLLLHKNASMPWFIFVPTTKATALYQVQEGARVAIEAQWNSLASWVHQRYDCKRVNVAAIGNLVPQLHLHMIGRREDDPCWPGVVWGQALPDATWEPEDLASLQAELASEFALQLTTS